MTYGSIVVGTDGSATAERAIAQAAALAGVDGARLVIVTAYTPGDNATLDVDPDAVPVDIRHVLTDRVQAEELGAHGRKVAKEAGADKVVVQAIAGEPVDVLLEAAKAFDADLIVVGSRGLNSSAHFILGSVAGSVAHHAPCDVLVAHTTAQPSPG
jgi:nucleotide-binding universal stress UspA family protein